MPRPGTNTPMLLARSRHASMRSLERYARPGPEALARHVAGGYVVLRHCAIFAARDAGHGGQGRRRRGAGSAAATWRASSIGVLVPGLGIVGQRRVPAFPAPTTAAAQRHRRRPAPVALMRPSECTP